MTENRYEDKVDCNGVIWRIYKILHNRKYVGMVAHPDTNEKVSLFGYTKDDVVKKIVEKSKPQQKTR